MSIIYKSYGDGLNSFIIDGEDYAEEDKAVIPVYVLKKQNISDIPIGVQIELCKSCEENVVCVNIPASFIKINEKEFDVTYNELITRKYWDGSVDLKLYMETKRDIINERNSQIGDIKLYDYDDDGAYINIEYGCRISVDNTEGLIVEIEQMYNEIEGATDIALGCPFKRIEDCEKESDFTVKVLLPLFRKLGFVNVKYNHGNKEFGKDVTFARRTEFDDYEYYGIQVKYGDVSGSAHGNINELIIQAKDAFSMPFYDVYWRRKVYISKVVIAISGKFTQNAIEKIIDGIHDYSLKNNIIFIDGEKIEQMMEKYRRF